VGLNVQNAENIVVPWFERFLLAGINVVGTSCPSLMYPKGFYDQALAKRLENAAQRGKASLCITGIEPGFSADDLVATLLTGSNTIKSIRAQELFQYDTYPDEQGMKYAFGFAMPMDFVCVMENEGPQVATWGSPLKYVANLLGYEIESFRQTYEKRVTDVDVPVAWGVIPAGTVGAVRFETIGTVEGRDAIVIEHINRMSPNIAPDWPKSERDGTYRIIVEGDPNIQCEFCVGKNEMTAGYEGMVFTCMRAANMIPAICQASPGLKSIADLPITLPPSAFRSDKTEARMKGYGSAK
jgi:hypothetical protein